MRKVLFATGLGAIAAFAAGSAAANDQLNRMSQNPAEWAMPTGDYANTRYSKLKQINAANVGKLQVAWTFSTELQAAVDHLYNLPNIDVSADVASVSAR